MLSLSSGVVIVIVFICKINAKQLPDYMHKCSISDPKLNECFRDSANFAIPHITNGDKNYRIPSLNPLEVSKIVAQQGPNFVVTFTDSKSYGIDKTVVKKTEIDDVGKVWKIHVFIPRWELISDYDINGQILILPIRGNGKCNITTVDGNFHYTMKYKFITKKDGKEYMQIEDSNVTMTVQRVYSDFHNLFNGDKRLGVEMNKFLNENWKELHEEMKPTIESTMAVVITSIMNGILSAVPYIDIYST